MEETISKQAVLTILNRNWGKPKGYSQSINEISELQPAQPEPKKGKWIRHCKLGVWECDQCGTQFKFPFKHHYFCPNCGADMRGEQ